MYSFKITLNPTYSVYAQFRRFLTVQKRNGQLLSESLGMRLIEAEEYVTKNKIVKNSDMLVENLNFCKSLGYSKSDILRNPQLLRYHHVALKQRYKVMEEGGFYRILPSVLAKARKNMFNKIKNLKRKDYIKKETCVPESFISYLTEFNDRITIAGLSDNNIWSEVHLKILKQFLKLKLNMNDEELTKLLRIHPMIVNKSLRVIQENIALAHELGFSDDKIIKFGYLLHNYPEYPKAVLKDFPNLAGSDMKKAMRVYPKLVMISPLNYLKIYGLLKEYEIEDAVIQKAMNVFYLSPETVKLRLQEINRLPELRVLFRHPDFLKLIVHHNRAKSRLSYLQQMQLKCASMLVLGNYSSFDIHVQGGKDQNNKKDVLIFLKNLFGGNIKNIEQMWMKHPYCLNIPLVDMEKTFLHLKNLKFKVGAISRVMHILLYPIEKIDAALSELSLNSDKYPKAKLLTQTQKLNLVLYIIEKQYHFTGNGVWKSKDVLEGPEKTLE